MATLFTIKFGKLQGDLDADGFTILNLDKTGLGLVKADVGLGNVDNTSDLNKPIGTATTAALVLKEGVILAGTTAQYWRGDKTWQNLGALALQGGATTLQELSVKGANATGSAFVAAKRNDYASSFAATYIQHYGASAAGTTLGLSNANIGELVFQNAAFGIIRTNGATPLIFGYNGSRRMRLMQGLNVGGDGDPGAGCITCYDTISTAHLLGTDLVLSAGATFGASVVLSGAGSNLTVGGNGIVSGSLAVTSSLSTGSDLGVGGGLAVVGAIVSLSSLPTSDPGVAGRIWRSGADVKVSI